MSYRLSLLLLLPIVALTVACSRSGGHVRSTSTSQLQTPDSLEHANTISALRRETTRRPVVAVLGHHEGAETTDYLVPYAILKRSGVADVWALSTRAEPMKLHPALTVEPELTISDFDARYPDGADYVIVPAMHNDRDPTVLTWIQAQHARGAVIVGVCSGGRILSRAGLLTNRSATGHWNDIATLRRWDPDMQWVPNRRYVVDGNVVTTTGVTASVPVSLALVEAMGGTGVAQALARDLGVSKWDATHRSGDFRLRARHVWLVVRNTLAFWQHDKLGVPVDSGVDLIALALTADAWSRTYRSRALTIAMQQRPVPTDQGLLLIPDAVSGEIDSGHLLDAPGAEAPAGSLDDAIKGIATRYGEQTAAFVALQLEYSREYARSVSQ